MVKWYDKVINQKPDKRTLIGMSKTLWIVREIDPKLEVLPLHAQFKAISLQDNKMSTAGYYHHQTSAGKNNWAPLLPDDDNIAFLQATVSAHYPSLFPGHQKILEAEKISNLIDVDGETGMLDNYNILLEKEGKILPATSTQALMLKYKESKARIYSLNRQINRLKKHIECLESESEQTTIMPNEANLLETSIKDIIDYNQLGLTILVSTQHYFSLILMQSCPSCNNNQLSDKTWSISSIGLQIKSSIECEKCNAIFKHLNEKETQFSRAVAAAGLAKGISRNAIQSSLATIGITHQISKRTYHRYQTMCSSFLIDSAKSSAAEALQNCIIHALSEDKKVLAVRFDCSWSYVRNASQGSYSHKPVNAFHVAQKSRLIKDNETEIIRTVYQGNHEQSSRQMEYAILIKVLNQISPSLEDNGLHLEVCINGDLDSNKTLAHIHIVSKISTDLKHLTRNVRKALRETNNRFAPNDIETRDMQTNGLIRHLQNNIQIDDPTLILQNSTLCYSSKTRINAFQSFLEKTFKTPYGQNIVTFDRTSQNEAFNQIKLVYLDKKIDYWKSFATRHAMADILNICMIENEHFQQNQINVEKIHERNKIRGEKYANEYLELKGWKKRLKLIANDEVDLIFLQIKYKITAIPFEESIKIIAENVFKFTDLRPGQIEAIKHYMKEKKDTLVIMKTSSRKSFCYITSAILFDSLTIVISLLKSLIQSQDHLIQLGIPCGGLLALSQGTIEYETNVFEEIALGFTRLLYVTPEKLLLNKSLRVLCGHWHENGKLQFVIDEVYCIFSFSHFREEWGKLGALKENYPNTRIMALTVTLSEKDIINIRNNLNIDAKHFALVRGGKKDASLERMKQLMDLIKDVEETDHAIIYCARVKDCLESEDLIPLVCNSCDNCVRRIESSVKQADAKEEILDMLKVVEALCEKNDKLIIPLDVIEVFGFSKNKQLQNRKLNLELNNCKKLKVLNTKVLAELALADLICRGLVKQNILLEKQLWHT
ncbi:24845_t:CDS:10 [Gigaspora margarita]|uniref:DNA 3'-5' helicase n=1 Tax=Gigaspora margarita TaxID=4874 RepID=A0ABN7UW44_GIGMA|nr:24845_t:CDS:10 [Gigaspora margarita]